MPPHTTATLAQRFQERVLGVFQYLTSNVDKQDSKEDDLQKPKGHTNKKNEITDLELGIIASLEEEAARASAGITTLTTTSTMVLAEEDEDRVGIFCFSEEKAQLFYNNFTDYLSTLPLWKYRLVLGGSIFVSSLLILLIVVPFFYLFYHWFFGMSA